MSRLKVAVVYGGPSREHDVSVNSGQAMLKSLDGEQYEGTGVFIDHDEQWHINGLSLNQDEALDNIKQNFDFVLLGLHGTFGEDGEIQGLLDARDITYGGSDAHASKLAMDKHRTSEIYAEADMKIPKERVIKDRNTDATEGFSFPVVIKPASQGSSFGVSIVADESEVANALDVAFKEDDTVLVQEYIKGREVSAGVVEDESGELMALPPTELIPVSANFFDYDAKYTPGATKEITPPDLPDSVIGELQEIAARAHLELGCSGYSRTDMIIRGEEIFLIETNTLPGMTGTSILPQQAAAAGISFSQLVHLIIQAGLRRKRV